MLRAPVPVVALDWLLETVEWTYGPGLAMALGDSGDVIDATCDEREVNDAIPGAATCSVAGRHLRPGLANRAGCT
jgi:hypothetical protein